MTKGRPFAGCETCGACKALAQPRFAGVYRTHCPSCGASRYAWRRAVVVDQSLPAMPKGRQYGHREAFANARARETLADEPMPEHPMLELLTAARAGNRHAQARATALYGRTWRRRRRVR